MSRSPSLQLIETLREISDVKLALDEVFMNYHSNTVQYQGLSMAVVHILVPMCVCVFVR